MQKLPLCFPWEMLVPWRPGQEPSNRFIKVPKRVTHLDQQRQKEEPFSKTLTFICTRFYRLPPLEPWVF